MLRGKFLTSTIIACPWKPAGAASSNFVEPDAKGKLMSTMPSPRSSDFSLTSVPAFWPMAIAAAMLDEGRELYARNLKFVDEEIKIHDELRPTLATPNQMRLNLRTMALRDYGTPKGIPTLVDAPTRAIPPSSLTITKVRA